MDSQVFNVSIIIVLSVLNLFTIYYSLTHKSERLHKLFLCSAISIFLYGIFYLIYSFPIPISLKLHSMNLQLIFGLLCGTLNLLMIFEFYGFDGIFESKYLYLLFSVIVVLIIGAITNPWYHLLSAAVTYNNTVNVIAQSGINIVRGPLTLLVYVYSAIIYTIIILFSAFKFPKLKGNFSYLIILLIPFVAIAAFILSIIGFTGFNLIFLSSVIINLLFFIAIFFTNTFDAYQLSWKTFVEHTPIGLIFVDVNGMVINYNPKFKSMFNLEMDIKHIPVDELNISDELLDYYKSVSFEKFLFKNDMIEGGDFNWMQISRNEVVENGKKLGDIFIFDDVTKQYEYEQSLIKSDAKKTVLIKDVHHRVKNNLQIINSYINLEERFNDDPDKVLKDTKSRIASLSLIHETIYNEKEMDYISIKEFFNDFDTKLKGLMEHANIEFINEFEDLTIYIDNLTPLVLLVNELTTNSFKHAFSSSEDNNIVYKSLKSYEEDGFTKAKFHYKDNGKGLDDDFDVSKSKQLGFVIMKSLVSQLGGEYEVFNDDGFNFVMTFPIQKGE